MRILVLGGTHFLGRHLIEAALARGHEVTLFHRGKTNPGLFPEAEELFGDRDGGLEPLETGSWDAVVDDCGYVPRVVRQSAELLRDRAGRYCLVSTVAVYADFSGPLEEESVLRTPTDETVEDLGEQLENYGPLKVLCERVVQEVYGPRALVVRPGLIVGPHDQTNRFTYWATRLARGGEILAPGPPQRRVQFVDARDLTTWMLDLLEREESGVFNAANEGVPWGELLGGADVRWVPDAFLLEHGVGQLVDADRVGVGDPERKLHPIDVSRAVASGLRFRPVWETLRDTAEWDAGRGDGQLRTDTGVSDAGLAPEREAELLAAWHAR